MLFDREAIEAGKNVIEHWKNITLSIEKSKGPSSCAYCKLYRKDRPYSLSCSECPICYFTCEDGCRNTPYQKYNVAQKTDTNRLFYASKMKGLVDKIFVKSLLLFDIKSDYFNDSK